MVYQKKKSDSKVGLNFCAMIVNAHWRLTRIIYRRKSHAEICHFTVLASYDIDIESEE